MALKATNCLGCGKLFLNPGPNKYCPECMQKREEQMDEIASFVRDNPRSSVREICAALGVKKSLVIAMLQSGRLEESHINIRYPCAACGKMIRQGRYCKACGKKITGEIAESLRRVRENAAQKEKKGIYSKDQWLK
ncbi:MAG: hypothetical protein J5477_05525 [Schwartzia sp.]|nr:hypothetical protein [Schwartzia sp. (in: firmicutes)]